jgi:hypothetical protein
MQRLVQQPCSPSGPLRATRRTLTRLVNTAISSERGSCSFNPQRKPRRALLIYDSQASEQRAEEPYDETQYAVDETGYEVE